MLRFLTGFYEHHARSKKTKKASSIRKGQVTPRTFNLYLAANSQPPELSDICIILSQVIWVLNYYMGEWFRDSKGCFEKDDPLCKTSDGLSVHGWTKSMWMDKGSKEYVTKIVRSPADKNLLYSLASTSSE